MAAKTALGHKVLPRWAKPLGANTFRKGKEMEEGRKKEKQRKKLTGGTSPSKNDSEKSIEKIQVVVFLPEEIDERSLFLASLEQQGSKRIWKKTIPFHCGQGVDPDKDERNH